MQTGKEIKSRFYETIYIVESPNHKDIESNRKEGDALNAALVLAQLNSKYYFVSSQTELNECFIHIALDINNNRVKGTPIPYLHFSLHGNEKGVFLTNDDFISWEILRNEMLKMNHQVQFVNSFGRICSRFYLSMSVCKGFNAYKMFDPKEQFNPFSVLVGPIDNIDWSDSLVAYVAYYHNLMYKRTFLKEAVIRMNIAAGLDKTFKIFLDNKLNLL
jgi:hypothetical protein